MAKSKMAGFNSNWMMVAGALLVVAAVVLALVFLMKGEETVSGGFPEPETSAVVVCKKSGYKYYLAPEDTTTSSNVEVTLIFSNEKVQTASLIYKATYPTETEAAQNATRLSIEMNKSFGGDLGHDALNMNHSTYGTEARMSLNATGSEYNARTKAYFLVEGNPSGMDGYEKDFKERGFECVVKK